jgi:hypothetical protein
LLLTDLPAKRRTRSGGLARWIQEAKFGTIGPVNAQVINPGAERGNETDDANARGLASQEQLPEPALVVVRPFGS